VKKVAAGSPRDLVRRLERWFKGKRRDLPWRRRHDLYGIWVSEVMLQQTRVGTVVPYYRNFLRRFPSLKKLAAAPLQDVLKVWEGLGYYSRARNLWRAARLVEEKFHGRIPGEYDRFIELPGVGEYIAAAVMSIGCDLAIPVVDGNVLRVVSRWRGIGDDIRLGATKTKVRSFLRTIIPAAAPGRFNEALMELGALVCLANDPLCRQCPLRQGCFALRLGRTGSLPAKSKKRPVPTYRVALAAIVRGGKIFIQQRLEQGHLGGLWEFPGGKCHDGEKAEKAVVRECREELGIEVEVLARLAEVDHAYSHFKVRLRVFICRSRGGRIRTPRRHAWVRVAELKEYPFPAANHKFFPKLKEYLIWQAQRLFPKRLADDE
jgi:A/G-specific adenine glycosylase